MLLAQAGITVVLQQSATTGNGIVITPGNLKDHSFEIEGSAGVATGAIQVETSFEPDYTGTWWPVSAPISVVAVSKILLQFEGAYGFFRARFSINVTGGTATVKYRGINS